MRVLFEPLPRATRLELMLMSVTSTHMLVVVHMFLHMSMLLLVTAMLTHRGSWLKRTWSPFRLFQVDANGFTLPPLAVSRSGALDSSASREQQATAQAGLGTSCCCCYHSA